MMTWKVLDLLWKLVHGLSDRIKSPSILPLKFVGIVNFRDKRERVRLVIRHDLDWDRHYERSKRNKRYWYDYHGNKEMGKLQVMDLVVEWRFGAKGLS